MGARRPVKSRMRGLATRLLARWGAAPVVFAGYSEAKPAVWEERRALGAIQRPQMPARLKAPVRAVLVRPAIWAKGVSVARASATVPVVPSAAARTEHAWRAIRSRRAVRGDLPARLVRAGAARKAFAAPAGRQRVPTAVVRARHVIPGRCPHAASAAARAWVATPTKSTPAQSTGRVSAEARPPVTRANTAWPACACVTRPRVRQAAVKATFAARHRWRRAEPKGPRAWPATSTERTAVG